MPRNQGTSRKGKPKKHERAAGMGRSLQKSRPQRHTPSASTGGMAMRQGVDSINVTSKNELIDHNRTSVLDVNNLDDFLIQAEMANREFVSEKEQVVVLDATAQATVDIVDGITPSSTATLKGKGPVSSRFAFQELSLPRRPQWDNETTAAELDKREKEAFLQWRRSIAQKEEEIILRSSSSMSSLGVTPFEKNLEIWRQLWRVLERCSCIIQIVDARNPLFYLSQDLRDYTTKELGKPMVLLINKSDYLSPAQRQSWHEYFSHPDHGWDHIFFSAHDEQERLDQEAYRSSREELEREEQEYRGKVKVNTVREIIENEEIDSETVNADNGSDVVGEEVAEKAPSTCKDTGPRFSTMSQEISTIESSNVGVQKPLSREKLLDWLCNFADNKKCPRDPKYDRIPFGMVGFPNVGKSSVINVLMGNARNDHGVVRVGVASQPGKTKHFQTLLLPDKNNMLLCDCPGLVFPSFVNNTADLIAAGVYPIAQMRDWRPVMELLCHRIPREVLNAQYGIKISLPTPDAMMEASKQQQYQDGRLPPPSADEFLTSYCIARNMLAASSGAPDYQRASRIIIKEYADGKLLYCHAPPHSDQNLFQKETLLMTLKKTKKLREKLFLGASIENIYGDEKKDENARTNMDELEVDDDSLLFEVMGDTESNSNISNNTSGSNVKSAGKKKWGKKGRKLRNKDPYGMFTTPDDMLGGKDGSGVPTGLSVKGGKYGHKGYTRQTGYSGARAFH